MAAASCTRSEAGPPIVPRCPIERPRHTQAACKERRPRSRSGAAARFSPQARKCSGLSRRDKRGRRPPAGSSGKRRPSGQTIPLAPARSRQPAATAGTPALQAASAFLRVYQNMKRLAPQPGMSWRGGGHARWPAGQPADGRRPLISPYPGRVQLRKDGWPVRRRDSPPGAPRGAL